MTNKGNKNSIKSKEDISMYRFDFNKNMKLYLNEIKIIINIFNRLLIFVSFIFLALWSILGLKLLKLCFLWFCEIGIGLTGFLVIYT